jgi:hypothetical protein
LPEFGTVWMRSARSSRRLLAGALVWLCIPVATAGAADATSATSVVASATTTVTATVSTATGAATTATTTATGAASTATSTATTVATGAADTAGAVTTTATEPVAAATTPPADSTPAPAATDPATPTTTTPAADTGATTKPATDANSGKDSTSKDSTGKGTTDKPAGDKSTGTTDKSTGTAQTGDSSSTKTTTPSATQPSITPTEPAAAAPQPAAPTPAPAAGPPPPPPAPAAVAQVRLAPPPFGLGILGGPPPAIVRQAGFASAAWPAPQGDLTVGSHRAGGVTTLFATPVEGAAPQQASPYTPAPDVTSQRPSPPRHATASEAHRTKAPPVGGAGDDRSPSSPAAPPGHGVVAGSVASSGSGAAPVLFFAILLGVLAYAAQELRRHRFSLVLAGPVGIVSPQQRPG